MGNINNMSQLFSRAIALHQAGDINDAEAIYLKLLESDPHSADTLNMLGTVRHQQGNHEEAIRLIGLSLELNPCQSSALNNRGLALYHMQRYDEALASFQEAIALKPDYVAAFHNRGKTLKEMKRHEEALTSYRKAISLKPDFAEVHNDLGALLQEMSRYGDALASYDTAIALTPGCETTYYNRGNALRQLTCYDEAVTSYEKAIALKPGYAEAYNNQGIALQALQRHNEAVASCEKAIALKPDYAEAYNDQGVALQGLQRHNEAVASYEKAIELKPEFAEAYHNRGLALHRTLRYGEALASFDKALALKPDIPYLWGIHLHNKMHLCDWRELDTAFDTLAKEIEAGKPASPPFPILATPLSMLQQRQCAEIHIRTTFPPSTVQLWNGERYSHDRIRIGYFSSEFRKHPLAYLMAGFFEFHDRSKFEVTAFSFGASVNDAMRARLEKAIEVFIDVTAKSEAEIAALARNLEIDIAIDLNGFTGDTRSGIFARRPAPVQVSYMGYPGTMGAAYIDYLIGDSIIIPEDHKRYYAEKIVYLPHSYWVTDSTRKRSAKQYTRQEMGLPENGFVFCCFNNNYKITPDVFDIWIRLLHKVDGGILWLLEGNPTAANNLRAEAKSRGLAVDRLVFAKRVDQDDHLVRHRLADLFLDTFNCNAHTTTSDALWEGLPVLTCIGETFAGRVAASLLSAANLPELITRSHQEYEAVALELATNPKKLSSLRMKLAQNRDTCPLFNTALFTRHFEDACVKMWERSQAGLSPDDIVIAAQRTQSAERMGNINNMSQLFSRAIALHQAGHINDAETIYLTILETDPHNSNTLNMLGTIRHQQGNHEEAIQLIGLSLEVNPRQPSALNNRGLAWHHVQRYDEALASYQKAIELKPDYATAFHNLGKTLKVMKRPEEALASYRKAISLRPDFAEVHNDLGALLQEMSGIVEALSRYDMLAAAAASYRQAIHCNPDFAVAHNNLSTILRQLGQNGGGGG